MRIPFVDLRRLSDKIDLDVFASIRQVVKRSSFILGPEVTRFEEEFATYCQSQYCVGVASGTDALHLACRVLDIGPGDEVILPANTFIATALGVTLAGATPVFVDCREEDFCIDPDKINGAINSNTKAIIPVHLYGQCADLDKISDVARSYGIRIIEDASQAHGALYKATSAGIVGDIGCFSFYPGKNLGAYGDAGALITNEYAIAEKLRKIRNYGSTEKYIHDSIGFNSRMDTVQACVLSKKLEWLDECNDSRRESALRYHAGFQAIDELILPIELQHRKHVYHLYVCRYKSRDRLMRFLNSKGIDVLIHYPTPIHLQKAYRYLGYSEGDFPVAEKIAREIFSLPMFPFMKAQEIAYIKNTMERFFGEEK